MSAGGRTIDLGLEPGESLSGERLKACCASLYLNPAVRWLLDGDLHPGGAATTRRALELIEVGPQDRLLDVASGAGASALLAARELGCEVVGIEYSEEAVAGANAAAEADGSVPVDFLQGDAESLPLPDEFFDAVLCECSLCTFPDKVRAVAEIRRVLRPGGRVAISDVVVDHDRLEDELSGDLAVIACVGQALDREGYEGLLNGAGLELSAVVARDADADRLAERVSERLRGARLLGGEGLLGSELGISKAIKLVGMARDAIAEGSLGYAIFAARG